MTHSFLMTQSWQEYRNLCKRQGLKLWLRLKDLADNEEGQDLVEYGLLAGFVAVSGSVFFPEIAELLIHVLDEHLGHLVKKAAKA